MNIVIHEFKSNFRSLLIWSVSLVFLYFVASIEFNAFNGNPEILDAMAQFDVFFQALGAGNVDITTPSGFLSLVSIYIYLPLSIYSGMLGAGIISKEEKNRTAEFLFTLPISRRNVLINKVIVAFINTIVINVVLMVGLAFIFMRFNVDSEFYQFLINLSIGVLITQFIFLGLGLLLSSLLKQYKLSGAVTVSILITTFMLNILIGFVEDLDFLKYISPFNYFSASMMLEGDFQITFVLISLGLIISTISGLFYFYPKRDLYI
jgi:ABC-2 type transport system permease protein